MRRLAAASPGSVSIPGTRRGDDRRDRLGAGLCASEEIDVELDAVVTVDDVRDIECDTFAILYDAATFGGRGAERNLQQTLAVELEQVEHIKPHRRFATSHFQTLEKLK